MKKPAIWTACLLLSQQALAYGNACALHGAFSTYPSTSYGWSNFASAWDCSCNVNSGYHYTYDVFGVSFGFSPVAWDFKLFSFDACANDAPDCMLSASLGPFSIGIGC